MRHARQLIAPLVLVLLLVLVSAAAAAAAPAAPGPTGPTGPTGATGPSGPATPPKVKPKPKRIAIAIRTPSLVRVSRRPIALTGQAVVIEGRVRPYRPHTVVTVRIMRGHKRVKTARRLVRRVRGTHRGRFAVAYKPGADGRIAIHASHKRTASVRGAAAKPQVVTVIEPRAAQGSRGLAVQFLQQQLARLHYGVSRDGVFGDATARAVLAYRKLNGLDRTSTPDARMFFRLAEGRAGFTVRYPSHGRHVEADLTHQVLALIDAGGHVYRIFPTSSGKPSTPTVLGTFHVYMQELGTNSLGMVDSSYFIRGYAIHGYHDVPTYAASHGCLRVPIPVARFIHDWLDIGTTVDVYYR